MAYATFQPTAACAPIEFTKILDCAQSFVQTESGRHSILSPINAAHPAAMGGALSPYLIVTHEGIRPTHDGMAWMILDVAMTVIGHPHDRLPSFELHLQHWDLEDKRLEDKRYERRVQSFTTPWLWDGVQLASPAVITAKAPLDITTVQGDFKTRVTLRGVMLWTPKTS